MLAAKPLIERHSNLLAIDSDAPKKVDSFEDEEEPLRLRQQSPRNEVIAEEEHEESVIRLDREGSTSSKVYDSGIFIVTNTTFYGGQ